MKSKFISAAVLAVAAFTSMGASAEIFNSWMFDQMAAPSTRTRAEVKAEVIEAQRNQRGVNAVSASAFNGAIAQQNLNSAPVVEKAGTTPQAAAGFTKTSQ
jgi:hypothetical protein